MKLLIFAIALQLSSLARADSSLEFVHITCIPEALYFQFEYKSVDSAGALTDAQFDEKKRSERMRIWQRHGYFDPHQLVQDCRLPESTYKLVTSQSYPRETGVCGGAPPIVFDLLRNGTVLFKSIVIGADCSGGSSVLSVEINDGLIGWSTRRMSVCVLATLGAPKKCKFLSETYSDITKSTPITSEVVRRYATEN